MQKQILWVLHQRFICLDLKFYFAIFGLQIWNYWMEIYVLWIVVASKKLLGNMYLHSWVRSLIENILKLCDENSF